MRKVAVSAARDHFTDLVNEVAYTREPVTLTRRGRPLAILVPMSGLEGTTPCVAQKPEASGVSP